MCAGETATRLHMEDGLGADGRLEIGGGRLHFLRNVLRLRAGARLALFNARDGEWQAEIALLTKSRCVVNLGQRLRAPQPEVDLWLLFAPLKRTRIDFLAEKATELGVSRLQPLRTRFTAVTRVNQERLAANAREAAEQCGRLSVPEVAEMKDLGRVLDGWPKGRRLLLCAERGAARPIAEALLAAAETETEAGKAPWAVLVGPEGGFSQSELDLLVKLPFVTPVDLGPRTLRAETAVLVALACWQALLGDGRVGRAEPKTSLPLLAR